ncbi:RNA-binding motif protein, X-linked 2-like isoform X3 [Hylaeus volcanicus]|uniref:RNA-binding motif protein, X-linked 2-like isoform X3 n=1 Tax=Hylaeus volcanicus TaxID=313075 RepID=UPI0023B79610|nr:RNA-binding motif protein, X-linked 2-like isoform X3 [Hylaeus volcanicus]
MSVTGPSYNINAINKLTESTLKSAVTDDTSWHKQYQNSCYIFVGGLPFEMNEGDTACVFSQYGELVDIHLVRDKKTGAFKGYGFIGYENQKSTILAVDNFNGYELLGRSVVSVTLVVIAFFFFGSRLRVDHCDNFRAPKLGEKTEGSHQEYKPSGSEGQGFKVYGCVPSTKCLISVQQKNDFLSFNTKTSFHKDADEMWAEEFEKQLQRMDHEKIDSLDKSTQFKESDHFSKTKNKNVKLNNKFSSIEQETDISNCKRKTRSISKYSSVENSTFRNECDDLIVKHFQEDFAKRNFTVSKRSGEEANFKQKKNLRENLDMKSFSKAHVEMIRENTVAKRPSVRSVSSASCSEECFSKRFVSKKERTHKRRIQKSHSSSPTIHSCSEASHYQKMRSQKVYSRRSRSFSPHSTSSKFRCRTNSSFSRAPCCQKARSFSKESRSRSLTSRSQRVYTRRRPSSSLGSMSLTLPSRKNSLRSLGPRSERVSSRSVKRRIRRIRSRSLQSCPRNVCSRSIKSLSRKDRPGSVVSRSRSYRSHVVESRPRIYSSRSKRFSLQRDWSNSVESRSRKVRSRSVELCY